MQKVLLNLFILLTFLSFEVNAHLAFAANTPAIFSNSISSAAPGDVVVVDNGSGSLTLSWTAPSDLTNFVNYQIYRSDNQGFVPSPATLVGTTGDLTFTDPGLADFQTYYYLLGANFGSIVEYSPETSIVVNNTSVTTVKGFAYMEAATNHANIKVKFNPVSPSAVLDSVYTNEMGYWEKQVNPGIYNITYEKTTYQTFLKSPNITLIDDANVGEGTILQLGTSMSGNVEGVWNGIYSLTGNITILEGDTLTILPGSIIRVMGNYHIFVYGYLNVAGLEGNPVKFSSSPADQIELAGQWQGFDFYGNSNDNSSINYAEIKNAADGIYFENASSKVFHVSIYRCSESGIHIQGDGANPNISYCDISYCYDGIYNYDGQPTVSDIYSHHNTTYGMYWYSNAYGSVRRSQLSNNNSYGFYMYYSCAPEIDSCMITSNGSWGIRCEAYGSPVITNCYVAYNNGFGICMYYDGYAWHSPRIEHCRIEYNTSWGLMLRHHMTKTSIIRDNLILHNGGGIYVYYEIDAQIDHNTIVENDNAGLYIENAYNDLDFHHNIVANNAGDGIYKYTYNGNTKFSYNTIYGNDGDGIDINYTGATTWFTNNIVANNDGYGINNPASLIQFEYNNVYSNGYGEISYLSNLPSNSWNFVSYNAQGDTADIYLNISENPLFTFLSGSADLTLLSNSPCINVGNPATLDPDGTASDIGAEYFEQGNPHEIFVLGTGDQSVEIGWQEAIPDSVVSYKLYYRLSGSGAFTYLGGSATLSKTVTGLTNNMDYDFVVTTVFTSSESGYSPKVSARPGTSSLSINPVAMNVTVLADTVTEYMQVTNAGTKELELVFPSGMPTGAAHFDGYYDYIHSYNQPQLEGMSELTVETWIKREINGHFEFISKHYRQFSLYVDANNHLGFYKGYTSEWYQSITSSYELPMNEWHHIAIVWKGTTAKFYADGQLVDEVFDIRPEPIPTNGYYFMIGCRASEYSYWFQGSLAEVRVWNVAKTQSQILRNYRSTFTSAEAGLVAYFPFHSNYQDQSSYAFSSSANGEMYLSSDQVSPFVKIPHIYPNGPVYTVAPGSSTTIPIKYYPTGQTGTFVYEQPIVTNISGMPLSLYNEAITYGQSVPSTPVHFSAVASTGLPYPVIITQAEIDDAALAVGDEIGIYDGSTCVGAGIFNGTFNFVVTVWKADPGFSLAGYTDGHPMQFVIYDASADLEATVNASYQVGDGTFGYGEFTVVSLSSSVFQIQTVPLTGNMFNLISFNKLPRFSSAPVVFGGLDNLQIVYNDQGFAWIPPYDINTLGDIYFKDGFHVFTNTADTIYYEGTQIDPMSWPILVESGKWNSIAYLVEFPMSPVDAIDPTLVDSIDIMQNSDGGAWIPALSLNTLGNLTPGKGYQIALSSSSDISIAYQSSGAKAFEGVKYEQLPAHFQFAKTGLPYQIVVETAGFMEAGIVSGDEIAVFDGEKCVGAVVYTGESRCLLTAWSADNQVPTLKGFTPGAVMKFKAYTSAGEIKLSPVSMNSKDNVHFKAATFAHISFGFDSQDILCSIFPNPFKNQTTIHLALPAAEHVHIQITDLSGRVLFQTEQLSLEAGEYDWNWTGLDAKGNSLPNGIYLIDIQTDSSVFTQQLIRM